MFDISTSIPALEPLLVSILILWLSMAEDYELLNSTSTNLCAARVRSLHTPIHYPLILGVPILPVPTLIGNNELIKSQLRLVLWHNAFNLVYLQDMENWFKCSMVIFQSGKRNCVAYTCTCACTCTCTCKCMHVCIVYEQINQ